MAKKRILLLSCRAAAIYSDQLSELGFHPIALFPDDRLNTIVADHADTLIFSCKNKIIMNREYYQKLNGTFDATLTDDFPFGDYPNDIKFNCAVIGNYLLGKLSSLSEDVLTFAKIQNLEPVDVKQGYAGCSTLVLDDRAIITSDENIASAAEARKINCLKISAGHIALDGIHYGFIGGAAFSWDDNVCFFGVLEDHPDGHRIYDFCRGIGINIIELSGELTDYGGAVVI